MKINIKRNKKEFEKQFETYQILVFCDHDWNPEKQYYSHCVRYQLALIYDYPLQCHQRTGWMTVTGNPINKKNIVNSVNNVRSFKKVQSSEIYSL